MLLVLTLLLSLLRLFLLQHLFLLVLMPPLVSAEKETPPIGRRDALMCLCLNHCTAKSNPSSSGILLVHFGIPSKTSFSTPLFKFPPLHLTPLLTMRFTLTPSRLSHLSVRTESSSVTRRVHTVPEINSIL